MKDSDTAHHNCLQMVEEATKKSSHHVASSMYALVCVSSHTGFCIIDVFISRGFISHFPFFVSHFLPCACSLSLSVLLPPSLQSQECTECPYLCPCKHKREPVAEVEFLCRSQAGRPHHTLASRQPAAKMAPYIY